MAITVSVMQGGASNHPTTSTEANGLTTDFVTTGVIGTFTNTSGVAPTTGAFSVNAQGTPDMTVAVGSGIAYVAGTPASQLAQKFRVYNSASANTTISANASGSTKYDWVYIKLDATLLNAPTLAGDTTATIVTSRSTSQSADDGTPPTYGYAIAVVTVANGAVSITNSVIRDVRNAADIGVVAGTNTGWTTGALPVVSSVTENGNRSASITFASTVASILTPGMRIRTSRTVAAPTGVILLNGTTQYASKTTPTGTISTTTDDMTITAKIRLTSYPGTRAVIVSRFSSSGTNNGWIFAINSSGQLTMEGYNASNSRIWTSYQSVPLNKWVTVSASFDMSGGTTTTNKMMFDGVDIPALLSSTGTPALWVNAGNLDIGCRNSVVAATEFFTGNIAQIGIFTGNVSTITQATIRSYQNQTLSGSEISCIGAWKLDQASGLTDLTATNNLTATGSPTYSAASPFTTDANGVAAGTYDWAIVTKVATTVATVQYPEGCAIPTSGGISTVDYSGVKAPFGMPVQKPIMVLDAILQATFSSTATPTVTDISGLSIPYTATGNETLRFNVSPLYISGTAVATSSLSIYIRDSTTTINQKLTTLFIPPANLNMSVVNFDFRPTAGAHTFVVSMSQSAAGTMSFVGAANTPALFSMEVLGLA